MPDKTYGYADRARLMAYRATWIDSGKKCPIPPIPPEWRGDEVFQFVGEASPLRSFALQRFVESQRAQPPDFDNPVQRCHAAELRLWSQARAELHAIEETVRALEGPAQALCNALAEARSHRPGFQSPGHTELAERIKAAGGELRAARKAVQALDAAEVRFWAGEGAHFPSVALLEGKALDDALIMQAMRLCNRAIEEESETAADPLPVETPNVESPPPVQCETAPAVGLPENSGGPNPSAEAPLPVAHSEREPPGTGPTPAVPATESELGASATATYLAVVEAEKRRAQAAPAADETDEDSPPSVPRAAVAPKERIPSLVEVGWIMGWEGPTPKHTRDRVRDRFRYFVAIRTRDAPARPVGN